MKKTFKCFLLIILTFSVCFNVYAGRGCCSHHGGESGNCSGTGKSICRDGTISPSCYCSGGSSNDYNNSYSNSSNSVKNIVPNYIYGCTNSNSINYNPSANKDDGSCIAKVLGCTNKEAFNYNESANTDDGSCIAKVYGCTDSTAINYNRTANTPDGSCKFSKTETKMLKIKYKKIYKYKLFKKSGTVLQKGEKGIRKIVIENIVDEKGIIIETKEKENTIIKKPVNKIVSTKKKK